MRLLLIPRRLTDIQSELVLYWKLSAGSGGLWDKNWRGKKLKFTFEGKLPLSFLFSLLLGSGSENTDHDARLSRAMLRLKKIFATFAPRPFL